MTDTTTDLRHQFFRLRLEIKKERKHVEILTESHQNWRRLKPHHNLRIRNFRSALSYHRTRLTNLLEQLEALATAMRETRDCQRYLPEVERLLTQEIPAESPQ